MTPACAQACPTESIQYGDSTSCATGPPHRVETLHEQGVAEARLYGHDPNDGVGGDGAFFLLLDEPEVYGLPPDPVVTTRDLPAMWKRAGAGRRSRWPPPVAAVAFLGGRRVDSSPDGGGAAGGGDRSMVPPAEFRSYYGRPVVKAPVWEHDIAAYLFTGGLAAGSALLAAGGARSPAGPRCAAPAGAPRSARVGASAYFLVNDLGRPERFHHMLRVAKPTSPMSMGTWILTAFGAGGRGGRGRRGAPLLPRRRRARAGPPGAAAGRARRPAGRRGDRAGAGHLHRRCCWPTRPCRRWHEAYPELPFVFAGSALASGAGVGLIAAPPAQAGPAAPAGGGRRGAGAVRRAPGGDAHGPAQRALPRRARPAGCCAPGGR